MSWSYNDAILVVLASLALILTIFAIVVALASILGYREIRSAMIQTARKAAREEARAFYERIEEKGVELGDELRQEVEDESDN